MPRCLLAADPEWAGAGGHGAGLGGSWGPMEGMDVSQSLLASPALRAAASRGPHSHANLAGGDEVPERPRLWRQGEVLWWAVCGVVWR